MLKLVTNALTFQSYDLINNIIAIKCLYPSYPVLNVGNVLPISNWDVVQNVVLQRP